MSVYQNKATKKWYYNFMLNGERCHGACKGCGTISDALEYEADKKHEISLIQRGKITVAKVITLKQMFDELLNYAENNNRPSTFCIRKRHSLFLLELWGTNTPISDITPEKIENLKIILKQKGLSGATYNRYYSTISKAFNIIILNHRLNIQNPCIFVKKLNEDNHIMRYLTQEEEQRLMNCLAPHLKQIVICALTTGLRLQNVLQLKWESINTDMNFIEILKQENKGHKKIQIPLSGKFKEVLEQIGIKKNGYVFINPETKKPYTNINNGWKKALKRANIENFRFHDLRHTVGTRLVANGADLQTVKEFLAHSDLKTTQRYLHPTPENMKKAVAILDSF